jgi:uncharacterized repeat protein (TIGR01451 family)
VVVTDALPDGLTFVSASSVDGTWSCEAENARTSVTCDLDGTIIAGRTAAVDVTVAVAPSLTGDVLNTAVASASNAPDASGSWTNAATPLAELGVVKSHAATEVIAGESFAYTIVVSNVGPSNLRSDTPTTVSDVLPAGTEFVSASGAGWSSSYDDETRTVTLSASRAVPVGGTFPAITLTVAVDASVPEQTIRNTVTAANPLATASVTDTDDVEVTTRAAVSIEKSLTTDAVTAAGTEASFDLVVTNAGPSNAAVLRLADLVPAGMTVTALSGDGWECDVDDGLCARDTLAPGTSTVSVTVAIAPSVRASVLENRGTIAWADSDGVHEDDSTASVEVVERAALSLTKTAIDADGETVVTAPAGVEQDYRIVVSNGGPSDASGPVTVVDRLPAGLTYLGSNGDWSCVVDETDDRVLTCSTPEGIPAGGTAPALMLSTSIDPTVDAGELTNSATASSASNPTPTEPVESTIVVAPLANVSVSLSHSGSAAIDARVPFTVAVANDGPSVARDVSVVVRVPAGLQIVGTEGTDARWTCGDPVDTGNGTDVTCTLDGVLGSGETAPTLVLESLVTAGAYPSADVTADVTTSTAETTLEDNADLDALAVDPLSSLSITKTHAGTLTRGETVDYTITVTNAGPTEDPGVILITDELPAGLTAVAASGEGVTCEIGESVECTVDGALGVGASVSVLLTARVAADAPSVIVNTASVLSDTPQSQAAGAIGEIEAQDPGEVTGTAGLPVTGVAGVLAMLLAALAALGLGVVVLIVRRRAGAA